MHTRMPLVVCALLVFGLLAGQVGADPLRAPLKGAPALQIDAPAGWKVRRVDLFGASVAAAALADRSGLVGIAIIAPGGPAPPLRTLVQALSGAPIGDNTQSTPASLDGRAAEAFTVTQPRKGSLPERRVLYVIARIDDHHVALVVSVTTVDAPGAERKLIETAVAGVRVIPAAAPAK